MKRFPVQVRRRASTGARREIVRRADVHLSQDRSPHASGRTLDARVAGERQGVRLREDAVGRVLELTEGCPFFLQEYGRRAWGQDDDPTITLDDVQAAQPVVEADLDEEFYENRIGKLTAGERLYVSALAHLGDGPQQTRAIADLLARTTTSLSPSATI
jgi:hypothetical protein